MDRLSCWLISALVIVAYTSNGVSSYSGSGYIMTAPAVFRSGASHRIEFRIFNEGPIRVNANLFDYRGELLSTDSQEISGSGYLNLKIPSGHDGRATLKICGNCFLTRGYTFRNTTTVTIVEKGSSAFIQTDKPVYKPSQTVHTNIFTVDRDLKPLNINMTIYVLDPDGVKIMKWNNFKPICCGIVNFSFPLSEQPKFGSWKIMAEIQGSNYEYTFEVQKYVLPKFKVSINPPPYFRQDCEEFEVTANYVFGKPVVGRLTVNVSADIGSHFSRKGMFAPKMVLKNMDINQASTVTICLSELLPDNVHSNYKGFIRINADVTASDGSQFSAHDDTTPIASHRVNIEFTHDTKDNFKPLLEYAGKIDCKFLDESPASNVTVFLRVMVNAEEFIRQLSTSDEHGTAYFTIPGLPSDANRVQLEAFVSEIDGMLVQLEKYTTVKKEVFGWNSPSECFIQAIGPPKELQAGNRVKIHLHSSCPCDFDLMYDVMSRGNLVFSGSKMISSHNSKLAPTEAPSTRTSNGTTVEIEDVQSTCHTSFFLDITEEMAPLSRLLVYYVKDDGEGVADSLIIPVQPALKNQVEITSSRVETSPGNEIKIGVRGKQGSCACLAIVDSSVHLMRPGYFLSIEKIFEELIGYDLSNIHEDDGTGRDRAYGARSTHTRDSKFAFLDTGLTVMTDVVNLSYKQSLRILDDDIRLERKGRGWRRRLPRRRLRSYFPETWIWRCFTLESAHTNITVRVPDSITTWRADAVSLDQENGIGIAESKDLRSFKDFFVDFTLPATVVRGEQVQIQVTAYNYLNVCTRVRLSVVPGSGVSFVRSPSRLMRRFVCVDRQSSFTVNVSLQFNELGKNSIKAFADASVGATTCCPGDYAIPRIVSSDAVMRPVQVEVEGLRREYTHSVLFCPNERVNISTKGTYMLQFLRIPEEKNNFDFLVKAGGNVHIVLTEEEDRTTDAYEIVIGGHENSKSWIERNGESLVTAATDDILSEEEYRTFWISWENGDIQVGRGRGMQPDKRFMQYREPSGALTIINVGFATDDGTEGDFKLWRAPDSIGIMQGWFELSTPAHAIPDSLHAKATLLGDVMGPTLKNLHDLLSMPYGCGEQNMANFAPNIYILKYLTSTRQLTDETKKQAIHYLQTGYQRQLTYKRKDKSFSAFGNRDSSGSMWLTSFVLKSFAQAQEFIYIDPKELYEAREWVLSWQRRDGSFPAVGKIWNKDTQSGSDSDITLTSYVLICLLESGSTVQDKALLKARTFLEDRVMINDSPYTAALMAYALTLADSHFADNARDWLYDMSWIEGKDMYWKLTVGAGLQSSDQAWVSYGGMKKQRVVSAEVEMTSYALLTYTHRRTISSSLPIVNWLTKMRNTRGGFSSTQDTCTALQALSEYARLSYFGGPDLDVSLVPALSNPDEDEMINVHMDSNNKDVIQTVDLDVPNTLFVTASGDGCGLLQVEVTYNIPSPVARKAFEIDVKMRPARNLMPHFEDGIASRMDEGRYDMEACVRWLHTGSSNMAVVEFNLLTGLRPDLESLQRLLESDLRLYLKRFEVNGRKIFFYFDEIASTCQTCIRFQAVQEYFTGNVEPQPVIVYDYYEPIYETQFMYNPTSGLRGSLCGNETCDQVEDECVGCDVSSLDGNYGECHCSHDCGFEGPQVCGSNGMFYMNECRMKVAACELNSEITAVKTTECMVATEEPEDEVQQSEFFTPFGTYGDIYDDSDYDDNVLADEPTDENEISYYYEEGQKHG